MAAASVAPVPAPFDLSPTIVETLYAEALALSDEARAAFDLSGRLDLASDDEDMGRVALSCEALRTTTRMMHAVAWLLNQRAYFDGELSEFALRRHNRLPDARPASDPGHLALLPVPLQQLVERTCRFYERVERLDRTWRESHALHPPAVQRLRARLGARLGAVEGL